MGETSTRSIARQKRANIKPQSPKQFDLAFDVVVFSDQRIIFTVHDFVGLFLKNDKLSWTISIVPGRGNSNRDKLEERAKKLVSVWSNFSANGTLGQDELAEEGYDLFSLVFKSDIQSATAQNVAEMMRVAASEWLTQRDPDPEKWQPMLHVRITGVDIHLPWNLMFPFPEVNDANRDAFFGYFLCIEDESQPERVADRRRGSWGEISPTKLSLQLDEQRINTKVHSEVRDVLLRFPDSQLKKEPRHHSKKFIAAWGQSTFDDEIIYFCCHGQGDPPEISLSNGRSIEPRHIVSGREGRSFSTMPIVFLNTCSGSAPSAFAEESFVSAFHRSGCVAVIAPEAKIEENFAGWFGSRFLERLFRGMPLEASLADLAYEVRAEGRTRHMGLCGLLYSVNSLTPVAFQRSLLEGTGPLSDSIGITSPPEATNLERHA